MRITNTSTATWAVIALVVAMGSINAMLKAQDSRAIAKTVMPSVVLLTTLDSSGQPMSLGSGFVVGDGLVATNLHVISGASRGFAKLPNAEDKFPIQGTCGVDSVHDLAILSIPGLKATALHLGDSDQIAPGDAIYVVGNPEGLEGTFSTGVVSAVRKTGDDLLLQLTAPISPGSSGGPVTNAKGEVIGISVATLKDGQNLNFAIPSHYLASLLAKPTAVTSLVASATQPVAQGVGEISGAVWINMNDGSSNLQRGFQIWVMTADPLPRSVVTSCLGTAVSEHQKAVDQTLKSIKSMQDTFLADADVSLFTDSLKNDRDEIAQIQLAIGQLPAKMSVTDAFRLVTLFSEDDIPSFADAVDANLAKETRTDVDGKYTIGGLSEGDYFLRAEIYLEKSNQYIDWLVPVHVAAGSTSKVDLYNDNRAITREEMLSAMKPLIAQPTAVQPPPNAGVFNGEAPAPSSALTVPEALKAYQDAQAACVTRMGVQPEYLKAVMAVKSAQEQCDEATKDEDRAAAATKVLDAKAELRRIEDAAFEADPVVNEAKRVLDAAEANKP